MPSTILTLTTSTKVSLLKENFEIIRKGNIWGIRMIDIFYVCFALMIMKKGLKYSMSYLNLFMKKVVLMCLVNNVTICIKARFLKI